MNEPLGARVMRDSGSAGLDGSIGSGVLTGQGSGGLTAYQWPFIPNINTEVRPERLVTVPDNAAVDPDGSSFEVSLRLRTKQAEKNVMNKGQSGNAGGYWKIETGNGKVKCVFRGPNGGLSLESLNPVADDRWHTVTCLHTRNSLTMWFDDLRISRSGSTGPINNNRPLSIGGKSKCDQIRTDCDYYSGWIDWLRIGKS